MVAQAFFFWLNAAFANAYLMYKHMTLVLERKPMDHYTFMLEVCHDSMGIPLLGDYAQPREKNAVEFQLYRGGLTPSAVRRERWNMLSMTSMGLGRIDIVVFIDVVGLDLTNASAAFAYVKVGLCSALDKDIPFAGVPQ